MNWWQQLKRNGLARVGAIALVLMYLTVIAAEFMAPYDPYVSQDDGSLLPPTAIHWIDRQGKFSIQGTLPPSRRLKIVVRGPSVTERHYSLAVP
jgi:peptide/nickel transport system permease protein